MVSGQFRSQIKDATGGAERVVWRDPATVLFQVSQDARTTIPAESRLTFLGPLGSATWMIPQVQRPGILWAGWNTEDLASADISSSITWTLQSVQGPGTVAVFQTGSFGAPDVIFNSADGLPDQRQIAIGVHAHANWAFSQPGAYRLTLQMAATRPSAEFVSDTQTLDVFVEADPVGSPAAPSRPSTPSASSPPPAPASPTSPAQTGRGAAAVTFRARTARITGRTLSFKARLPRTSRLEVIVRRAGRTVTRAKTRTVVGATRERTLRVLLGRRLKQGATYQVVIRAHADANTVDRTLALRVPKAP